MLHHVIPGGREPRQIFRDDSDRPTVEPRPAWVWERLPAIGTLGTCHYSAILSL